MSLEFKNFCKQNGIKLQYTVPRIPEQNEVAERLNRTLLEKSRCTLYDSKLDKEFWGDALRVAVYLLNRTETATLPAEI